jgi:hypothetical protein
MNKIETILVKNPTNKAMPPITSSKLTGRAHIVGNPTIFSKKSSVPGRLDSFGKP